MHDVEHRARLAQLAPRHASGLERADVEPAARAFLEMDPRPEQRAVAAWASVDEQVAAGGTMRGERVVAQGAVVRLARQPRWRDPAAPEVDVVERDRRSVEDGARQVRGEHDLPVAAFLEIVRRHAAGVGQLREVDVGAGGEIAVRVPDRRPFGQQDSKTTEMVAACGAAEQPDQAFARPARGRRHHPGAGPGRERCAARLARAVVGEPADRVADAVPAGGQAPRVLTSHVVSRVQLRGCRSGTGRARPASGRPPSWCWLRRGRTVRSRPRRAGTRGGRRPAGG